MGIVRFIEPADIRSPGIHRLFYYWQGRCGGRRLPAKSDIDPAEIKALLPYITMTEIHREPLRVRFRLVGTEVARVTASDFTNSWVPNAGWDSEIEAATLSVYQRVVDRGTPVFGVSNLVRSDGRQLRFEWAKFPLTSDGQSITHAIGLEDHRYPGWESADPIEAQSLATQA